MKHDIVRLIGGDMAGLRVPKANASQPPTQPNQLCVIDGQLMRASLNEQGALEWKTAVDARVPAYEFGSYTFTPAGATGNIGPTFAQLAFAYGSAPFMASEELFTSSNGLQLLTIPQDGVYEIYLKGAARDGSAAAPAQLTLRLALLTGDVLTMAVAQQAANDWAGNGASYIRSKNIGLLAVAGGSGGKAGSTNRSPVLTLYDETSGVPASGGNSVNSSTIDGKFSTGCGGAGAGGDGAGPNGANLGSPAKGFVNGSVGGVITSSGGQQGGFGGGGAGMSGYQTRGVGGGGGYTGGNGSASNGSSGGDSAGFGGTNYCRVNNIVSRVAPTAGARGNGSIRITKVG